MTFGGGIMMQKVFAGVAVGLEVTLGFPVLIERLFDGVCD